MSNQDSEKWMLFELDKSMNRTSDELARVRSFMDSLIAPDEDMWEEFVVETESRKPSFVKRTSSNNYVIQLSASPKEATESSPLVHGYHDDHHHVDESEVLNVVEESSGPAITTKEVAESVGCTKSVARKHLNSLFSEGCIDRKESGDTIIWWPTEEEQDLLRGFGALSDTDIPEEMQKERERLREEWGENDDLMP